MRNIAFIINPFAGTIGKRKIINLIEKNVDSSVWTHDIVVTQYAGHATELASHYAQLGFEAVVAVGGDGTVNEVACGLIGTNTAIGVVPTGSGNGFARHLGIPIRIPSAIERLNRCGTMRCDYCMVNDKPFFVTCGCGFDAHISEKFQTADKRGIKTYIEKIVTEIVEYTPNHYTLHSEESDIETDAFLITCANCNQWGNAAQIAPKASIQDGKMDITIVNKFPLAATPALALRLFTKTIADSYYIHTLKTKEVTLTRPEGSPFHIDGDPVQLPAEVTIRIIEDGLNVLVEKRY